MRYLILLALGMLAVSSTGCATIARGDKQSIQFITDPTGATVQVDKATYTSPAEVKLKRNEVHTITVSKPGFEAITFDMAATWDGASLPGVALPGGSAMAAADRASGADLAFYPVPKIKLKAVTGVSSTQPSKRFQYKGSNLLTETEYKAVIEEERREIFLHRD